MFAGFFLKKKAEEVVRVNDNDGSAFMHLLLLLLSSQESTH